MGKHYRLVPLWSALFLLGVVALYVVVHKWPTLAEIAGTQNNATFLADFVPNVLAEAVGVTIGVLLGLWLDRKARARQERAQAEERRQRAKNALAVLRDAIVENRKQLVALQGRIKNNQVSFDSRLNTTVWEAIMGDLVQMLDDPKLASDIANHFAKLNVIARLVVHQYELFGGVAATVSGALDRRAALGKYLAQGYEDMLQETDDLLQRIESGYLSDAAT